MPGEDEAGLAAEARLALDADFAGLPAPNENGSSSPQQNGVDDEEDVSLCAIAERETQTAVLWTL